VKRPQNFSYQLTAECYCLQQNNTKLIW